MLSNTDMEQVALIRDMIEPKKEEPKKPIQEAPQEAPEAEEIEAGADEGDPQEVNQEDDIDLDEDAGREGEPAKPAIPAPSSFTAEEKEWFSSLPPNMQETVLRREREVTKALHRAQKEKDDAVKALEPERQQIAAERQQLSQQLALYGDSLIAEFNAKFADVTDPVKLANLDPVRATEFNAYLLKIQQANHARQQAEKTAEQERQAELSKFRQEQNVLLREKLKLDDDGFTKWDGEISEYLSKKGFRPEQIQRASAEALEMADKAMRWDRAMAKKQAAAKSTEPPPRFVKPGTQSNATAKDEQRAASMKRLRKTGDIRDAAAVIKGML